MSRRRTVNHLLRPHTSTSPETPMAACPSAGCWPSGHPDNPNPLTTGSAPCRRRSRCGIWCGWPRCAGASNTTTANSKTASAWTTSKAGPGSAGIAMSPSPRLPRRSAPSCAGTHKPLRRPDPLRGPARTPGLTRGLDRHLPHLPTTHPDPNPRTETPAHQPRASLPTPACDDDPGWRPTVVTSPSTPPGTTPATTSSRSPRQTHPPMPSPSPNEHSAHPTAPSRPCTVSPNPQLTATSRALPPPSSLTRTVEAR
jgi:hypothetical protein